MESSSPLNIAVHRKCDVKSQKRSSIRVRVSRVHSESKRVNAMLCQTQPSGLYRCYTVHYEPKYLDMPAKASHRALCYKYISTSVPDLQAT